MPTQLPRADLKGDARACRRFHEDHGEGFPSQWLLLVLADAHLFGEREQSLDLLRGVVSDLQEVAVGAFFSDYSGHVSCADRWWKSCAPEIYYDRPFPLPVGT